MKPTAAIGPQVRNNQIAAIAVCVRTDPARVLRIGLQCLIILCAFILLSGCMRQDYRFIGNMMETDGLAAMSPQRAEPSATPTPERLTETPAAGLAGAGRG